MQSWPVLNTTYLPLFFSSDGWHPLERKFGLLPMLWATLAAGLGALLIALPLGLATAIFSLYVAPAPLARSLNLIVAILAGIPSVVYGLWDLTVIVPLINQWQAPGASLLAAMLILVLMILPNEWRQAGAALNDIARALTLEPEILLMDEPCSALDPISSAVVEDMIKKLSGRYTIVIVTHNLAQARRIANYAAFFWMQEKVGKLVEFGQCHPLFDTPQDPLTAAYVSGITG